MRRAAKKDANQDEIVKALRAVGATVTPTHQLGGGFPDLAVGWKGRVYLMEVKDGSRCPSARKLTPDEAEWHRTWRGDSYIVESVADALAVMGIRIAA